MIARYAQVPEDERQGDPIYAAMVESIDESVGRVLAELRRTLAGGEDGRHLHLRQRRILQGHQQCAATGKQGSLLRRRHPRSADRQVAGCDQARTTSSASR